MVKEQMFIEWIGLIQLPSGVFKLEELICMLNTLPMDITYVNKEKSIFTNSGNHGWKKIVIIVIGRTPRYEAGFYFTIKNYWHSI